MLRRRDESGELRADMAVISARAVRCMSILVAVPCPVVYDCSGCVTFASRCVQEPELWAHEI